jgi:hypothetical protein
MHPAPVWRDFWGVTLEEDPVLDLCCCYVAISLFEIILKYLVHCVLKFLHTRVNFFFEVLCELVNFAN